MKTLFGLILFVAGAGTLIYAATIDPMVDYGGFGQLYTPLVAEKKRNLLIAGGIGVWVGLALIALGYESTIKWFTKDNVGKKIAQTSRKLRDSKKWLESEISDDGNLDFYAQAEEEVENKTYDRGLWAKALLEANGDESMRKITYMRIRSAQLDKERRRQHDAGANQR